MKTLNISTPSLVALGLFVCILLFLIYGRNKKEKGEKKKNNESYAPMRERDDLGVYNIQNAIRRIMEKQLKYKK